MTVANLVLAGRYRLDAPLGQRGDGWLCHAHDLVLGRSVLVKMFKSLVDEETAHAFAVRVGALSGLRHAHLVEAYDAGVADGHPYLVLEPVDGVDLLDVADKPLPAAETAVLGAGLADALACMHEAGIVHGELTPASVLVDVDARWQLAGPGVAVGTAAADVHALGLVLLNCLSEVIPGPLARVLAAMTGQHPERRPSAAVSAQRLRQAADALATGRRPSPVWGRVAGLATVGGVMAAAAIAFVPASTPDQALSPVPIPVPTQRTVPDPTSQQPASPPPPPGAHPTTTARPTTTTAKPPTSSADPTTAAPTTTTTTTTTTEAGPPKKLHRLPPGLLKKLLGLDYWTWPFDW